MKRRRIVDVPLIYAFVWALLWTLNCVVVMIENNPDDFRALLLMLR